MVPPLETLVPLVIFTCFTDCILFFTFFYLTTCTLFFNENDQAVWQTMAERFPPEDASRASQAFRGPFSEPRSQRRAPRQYPASMDTDLSLVTELRRSEEEASGQRSLPNNLVIYKMNIFTYVHIHFFFLLLLRGPCKWLCLMILYHLYNK